MSGLLPILLALALTESVPGTATATPAGICTLPMVDVMVDADSLAAAGWESDPMRIETLKIQMMANLGRAYFNLCNDGRVSSSLLEGKTLLLQNGKGAAEPLIYAASGDPHTLVVQFAFQDGPAPGSGEAEHALLCLATPGQCGFADR